jgi:hypothetical protein
MGRREGPLRILRVVAAAVAVGCVLAVSGCSESRVYDIGVLEVGPNPVQPDDLVTFTFGLTVVPERNFTVTAFVDTTAHASQTLQRGYDGLFEFVVGQGSDLVAAYGVGSHQAVVQVRIIDDGFLLRTVPTTFELQ